jgi:hypothetical protein
MSTPWGKTPIAPGTVIKARTWASLFPFGIGSTFAYVPLAGIVLGMLSAGSSMWSTGHTEVFVGLCVVGGVVLWFNVVYGLVWVRRRTITVEEDAIVLHRVVASDRRYTFEDLEGVHTIGGFGISTVMAIVVLDMYYENRKWQRVVPGAGFSSVDFKALADYINTQIGEGPVGDPYKDQVRWSPNFRRRQWGGYASAQAARIEQRKIWEKIKAERGLNGRTLSYSRYRPPLVKDLRQGQVPEKGSRMVRWAAAILGIVIAMGLAFSVPGGVSVARRSDWPQVTAHIDEYISSSSGSFVSITYVVDDQEYHWSGNPSKNRNQLKQGGRLVVLYNPDDPADCYSVPVWWPATLYITLGAAVMLCGLLLGARAVRVRRSQQDNASLP